MRNPHNKHVDDVEVYRDRRWWMVKIPEINGLTQARWRCEVKSMVRSYINIQAANPVPARGVGREKYSPAPTYTTWQDP